MNNNEEFSKFITEFGSKEGEDEERKKPDDGMIGTKDDPEEKRKKATAGGAFMQAEERNTGAISWAVYKAYSAAGKGNVVLPLLFCSLVMIQGATVMSSYWYAISSSCV